MNQKLILKIGGVPEHFNLPWHLAINSGAISELGVDASWQDFPGGTGSMVAALNDGYIDVAMLLTEGAIKGVEQGGDYEIISFYTQSPLIWGIHVPAQSSLLSLDDCKNVPIAISRYGSGSHLMAFILADQQNWKTDSLTFEMIDNLEGARDLFTKGGDHIFLWEKFMTQPLVDSGEFRRIAELPTPWPCFVVCVRKSILAQHKNKILDTLTIIFDTAKELTSSPIAAKLIASRYNLRIDAVEEWLHVTKWANNHKLDNSLMKEIRQSLISLNII